MSKRLQPTEETYRELVQILDFLNEELFERQLPACLITLQRKSNCFGYYSRKRFYRAGGTQIVDELAFNPAYFPVVPLIEVLQTWTHELCLMWQYHFGKASRSGYHNAEWSAKMVSVMYSWYFGVIIDNTDKQFLLSIMITMSLIGAILLVVTLFLQRKIYIAIAQMVSKLRDYGLDVTNISVSVVVQWYFSSGLLTSDLNLEKVSSYGKAD